MNKLMALFSLGTLFMLLQPVAATYAGSYGWDDIENVTGDLTMNILVGINEKGLLIGKMLGIGIAIGVVVGIVAAVFSLLLMLKNKGSSLGRVQSYN